MTASTEQERQCFEAWWKEYDKQGVVSDAAKEFAFDAWLAARRAPVVPQFSQVAKKKLDYLLEAGEKITGYAIQNKYGRRGAIDCHGFVYWWQDAAAPQPPEASSTPATRGIKHASRIPRRRA